ncbi:MAG: PBSX family phage terminase large subunit [Oscillospiraceae bacterium]|nr:PBSX family phage terminase large subunit [Oscillospiraceae bacterium]
MKFSPKQKEALKLFKNGGLKRINIFEGSVRSGKTFISMVIWGLWVARSPKESSYLMAGKTMNTLKRNVLEPMTEIFGSRFTYNTTKKEARLFGRRIYLEGAANAGAEGKIRGMTLRGAYCDELTLFDEGFFVMLLSRLSERGAKLIATTNPDNPAHWVKRDYLDNPKLDLLSMSFTLDDNIFLPREYVAALKSEFCGVFYDRFILGKWVAAEGRVYEHFSRANVISAQEMAEKLAENKLIHSAVGVDYGGNGSASAFVHVGFDAGYKNMYILSEYYDKRNRSAESLISAFAEYIAREKSRVPALSEAFCDSAEQLLVKSFRQSVRIDVRNARKKPINTRINMLNRLISAGRLWVSEDCPHLIEALETAVWDEHDIHKDTRLDNGTSNIDSLDAMEYAFETYERQLFGF